MGLGQVDQRQRDGRRAEHHQPAGRLHRFEEDLDRAAARTGGFVQCRAVGIDRRHHLVLRLDADHRRLAGFERRQRLLAHRAGDATAAEEAVQLAVFRHHRLGARLGGGGVLGAHDGGNAKTLAGAAAGFQ